MPDFYKLHCEFCNWTMVTNEKSDVETLYVYPRSKIQTKIPVIDPETRKLTESKWQSQVKSFRCQNCGRPVRAKKTSDPQDAINQKKLELEREEREMKLREEFEKEEKARREKKASVPTGREKRPKRRSV